MKDAIRVFQGGMAACNGYLIQTETGYILIDAPAGITEWILARKPDAKITDLLITHMHFDHIEDAARLQKQFGCTIHAHSPYNDTLTLSRMANTAWGINIHVEPFTVDDPFGPETHTAQWGGLDWHIHHVPGHSPDSIAYHLLEDELMFVGDIIFAGSIGRTDFPNGNFELLKQGIHNRILNQSAETRLYPGHGPYTSIKEEALNNPYLS